MIEWLYGSTKGYANTSTLLHEHLIRDLNPQGQQLQDLLLPGTGTHAHPWNPAPALDAVRFHRREAVSGKLHEYCIAPPLIPGGCTSLIRALGVSVNNPFKGILRNALGELIDQEELDAVDDATELVT